MPHRDPDLESTLTLLRRDSRPGRRSEPETEGARLPRPASALRRAWARGYGLADLRADSLAGCVVGVVALPLSMALAIASGVAPQYGLYTAIVAGALIALLGGSAVQVSGPTAAFVVLLAPVAARFGPRGLMLATAMAGVLLIVMGLARLGRLIHFVPYPVTSGFTLGIATVIAILQLRDFFGLAPASGANAHTHVLDRLSSVFGSLPQARGVDCAIGAATLALLLAWPYAARWLRWRWVAVVPAPLVAIGLATVAAAVLSSAGAAWTPATVGSRFTFDLNGSIGHGVPRLPPLPMLPWPDEGLSWELLRALLPSAFAIAMLGAIESLLSAVVADGMQVGGEVREPHDPDGELLAQGTGNLLAPFFGGFAATGAIARTATNVRSGARSPIAAVVHSAFLLAAVLALAPALSYLPMAALAALLLMVAWNMADPAHVARLLRIAPTSDRVLLVTCFLLTVLFDMVVAVSVGVVLGALLFMRRMAEVAGIESIEPGAPELRVALPRGVAVYRVAGPLFFGATQKALAALQRWEKGTRAVVLDLSAVPALDATGLVSLESAAERLRHGGVRLILAGLRGQPLRAALRAGLRRKPGVEIRSRLEDAVAAAGKAAADDLSGRRSVSPSNPSGGPA
jgi:SulP family sulfate permease